jgi:putative ABC transport system permease protein
MIRLAIRNLFHSPIRLLVSVGGVALALVLILSLDAILAGSERQMTAYIDYSGADIFVSQSGVRNMHMASSSLPRDLLIAVEGVDGVDQVFPILYLTNVIDVGQEQFLAYIIGVESGAGFGGAWDLEQGNPSPAEGEIVIDHTVAREASLGVGDKVDVLGRSFNVVGLARGTTSIINSVAFININDFFDQRGTNQVISYILATVTPGNEKLDIAQRIEAEVPNVSALPREQFSQEEASIIQDMGADVITIMNFVGLLIGLAVTGLTTYIATIARKSEFGMLKAIGAKNRHLYLTVIWQAVLSIALGLVIAVGLTMVLQVAVPQFVPAMELALTVNSFVKIGLAAVAIAIVSAVLPIRQISTLDPAMVFRR